MLKSIKDMDEKINKILCTMTLEEKIGQLVLYGRLKEREEKLIDEGKLGTMLNIYGTKKINELQKRIMNSKCKIPMLFSDDVIHGYKTIFPIPLAESCSFDLTLIEESAAIAAREASSEGINLIYGPMVDITRDPRWGRVSEGAGEDTFLGSKIAAARVKGLQRNDWNDRPYVTACPKHFIGYGAVEGGRDYHEVDMSERRLRETYLPPFRKAVKSGAGTIMCSFNDFNGMPPSGNKYLLKDILRDEIGFNGVIISDWESISELIYHGASEDKKEAALKAFNATVDIDMHSGSYEENLKNLLEEKKISLKDLDEAVLRILKLKASLRLFENPYTDEVLASKLIRNKEHVKLAREIAKKSIVLLKNENLLPISKDIKSIAVLGPLADDNLNPLGCWALKGEAENVVTVLEGIKNKLKNIDIKYEKGSDILEPIDDGIERACALAKEASIVLMVLGESLNMCGENHNRAHIDIPKAQKDLLKEVLEVNKKVVLILLNGRPLDLSFEDENVPAILEAWHLGDESGNAISDVIFGDYNPSGKLTMTFPRTAGQVPIYYNYKLTGRPSFKAYLDEEDTPLYPFGYGLSYTKFSYKNLELSKRKIALDESFIASCEIYNEGSFKGEEIVELYIRDVTSSITRPVKELKGFLKILLEPHEKKKVIFEIGNKELGFLNENYVFTVEPGKFKLWIGPDSISGLEGDFEVSKGQMP